MSTFRTLTFAAALIAFATGAAAQTPSTDNEPAPVPGTNAGGGS